MRYCRYEDRILGTCSLYQEEYDTFEGVEYRDCKCKDIQDCDYKLSLKNFHKRII